MAQEVPTNEVKVGEVYNVRLDSRAPRARARVVAIQHDLVHTSVITGFRVEWLDGDRPKKVVMSTTLEVAE